MTVDYVWERGKRYTVGGETFLCLSSDDVPRRADGAGIIPWIKNGRISDRPGILAMPPNKYEYVHSATVSGEVRVWVRAKDYDALSGLPPEFGEVCL